MNPKLKKLKILFQILRVAILALNIWLCVVTFEAFKTVAMPVLYSYRLLPNLAAAIRETTPASFLIFLGWVHLAGLAVTSLLQIAKKQLEI